MFRNYLKIAWRNLTKSKQQTIINLMGLTVGTVSCLTILLYVFAQLGYDQHHDNAESIYRVRTNIDGSGIGGEDMVLATASPPIAFAMKKDFPEVEEAARIVNLDEFNVSLLRSADSKDGYYEPRAYLADSTIFNVFKFKFIEGNAKVALNTPEAIVLSSSLAFKLFGNEKAIGKTLLLGSGDQASSLTVTAVFDDSFAKSHLNPNYILNMNSAGLGEFVRTVTNFAAQNFVYSYVKLSPKTSASNLQAKMPDFLNENGAKDLEDLGMKKELLLQKATDIHLNSQGIKFQIDEVSNSRYLYFLMTLAFIIQLVACINFINLSTARASKRAKEIGVRKVIGADKNALIGQFLGESLLLSLFTVLISIPITILLLPMVNDLTLGSLTYSDIFNWKIGTILFGLGVFTGFASGIYPALVLSSIKPVRVLKSSVNFQAGGGNLRKVLVVFQFVVSIVLITSVIIITQQFSYTQNKNLGFNKENLITIRLNQYAENSNYEALKSQFLNIPGVTQVAGTAFAPSERVLSDYGLHLPGKTTESNTLVQANRISDGYFETMNIHLLQGRDLRQGDQNQIIVNQATLNSFNIKEVDAIGSKLLSTYEGETQEFEIVGVVKDYHFASLKEAIGPMMLFKNENPAWLMLRTKTTDYQSLLSSLEKKWEVTVSDMPFTYAFVDQEVGKLYEEERRLGKLSTLFTFLAILISCLGLFGLVSYVAEQKKKEIGIRKVLGASINSVIQLLTKDFVKLVGIAFLIASPIAFFFMQRWLEDFTYRIDIHWWVFALAGSFALIITILTVGFQSIKSALANPVKSLRTE